LILQTHSKREPTERPENTAQSLLLALEAAGIGIFEVNFVDGMALGFKPAARQIFGFAPDAPMTAAMVDALVHEDDRADRMKAQEAAVDPNGDGAYRATYRIRRASDGALRWISAHGQAFFHNGQVVRVVGVNRDITDEVNAAQVLREKAALAERLTALASTLPGAVFTYRVSEDGFGHMPYALPKIEDVTGFTPETLARNCAPLVERIYADDLTLLRAAINRSVEAVGPFHANFRYHHPKKGLVWIECDSAPLIFDDGEPVWQGHLQDVTGRKSAEAALIASEKRLRAVFDAADDAIFTVDDDGVLTSLNAAGLLMFGYRSEDVIGASADCRMHDPARARRDARFWSARKHSGPKNPRFETEIEGRRQDGSLFPMSVSFLEVDFGDKPVFIGFARDLTEQRLNEARVRQMNDERLTTLESMAAGLAHEVNQPLAAGATFLKVARRMLDARGDAAREEPPEVLRLLDKASAQIVRAGRIITRVREFSTRGEPDKTYQNLHQLIAGVGKAMSEDAKLSNFRLLLRLNAENDRVIVDRMQISQVLVNLIRNAAQAMQSSIAQETTQEIIVSTALDDKHDIRVQVIDHGVGLSEETHKSLFEPFKTSKPSGMGVGLSISRAIVEAHFGKIWAEPNPVGGAIFSFSLPLAEQELP
jgi:PAS domain S-box-containing protein